MAQMASSVQSGCGILGTGQCKELEARKWEFLNFDSPPNLFSGFVLLLRWWEQRGREAAAGGLLQSWDESEVWNLEERGESEGLKIYPLPWLGVGEFYEAKQCL